MSHFEFNIPLQKDELLESEPGHYRVADVIAQRALPSKLQDAGRGFNSDGVEFIFDHFDTYFSILVHGNKSEWTVINKGFEHMDRACRQMQNQLELILEEKELDPDLRAKTLNCVKMVLYLYTSLMKVKDVKLATENATKLTLGKKGKRGANMDENGEWSESNKHTALVTLYNVLQLPLSRLWDPPLAEENFVGMVSDPCYKALEEQIIKNKTVRETVFQILGVLIKKYNHGTSCLIKLVQVLQLVEHAISPISSGIVQLTQEFGLATFAPQMAREIAETLASSTEGEGGSAGVGAGAEGCSSATRYLAQFLVELTAQLPKEMACAIKNLQRHLETDESYPLRISILGMMCEVICSFLKGEGLTDVEREQRDDFLEDLEEHILDLSALVRAKVLQYWCRLQKEECIPVARQRSVLERAARRLRDRAAIVRKAAVQLLKIFLEFNPFSAQLTLEMLEENLKTERKNLEELQATLDPGPDPQLVKKWDKLEADLREVIHDRLDQLTQDDPMLSQASLDNFYTAIRRHLREKDYYKAFMVVRHAERQYPEAKLLRCDMDKNDQEGYFIALLRNIFVILDKRDSMTMSQECEAELSTHKRIEEKETIVAFLEESLHFGRIISEAVPIIHSMLGSRQAGDVSEAIEFFTAAHHFNIESAKVGVTGMLQLVWSTDQDKREAVERAYSEMYLQTDAKSERAKAYAVAKSLVALVADIERGNALALEWLLGKWVEKGDVSPAVIQVLWEMFSKKLEGTTDKASHVALAILNMIAKSKPSVALANINILQDYCSTGDYRTRLLCTQLLLSLAKKDKRYPGDHPMFKNIHDGVLESFSKMNEFMAYASAAVEVIYGICDSPEIVCAKILKECSDKLQDSGTVDGEEKTFPVEYLARFIYLLGHIAMHQLIYLDVSVYSELRRRNQTTPPPTKKAKYHSWIWNTNLVRDAPEIFHDYDLASDDEDDVREERKEASKKQKKKIVPGVDDMTPVRTGKKSVADTLRRQTFLNSSSSSASCRNQRSASVTSNKPGSANDTLNEDDSVGLEGAVADDADAEYIRCVCAEHIVLGTGALAQYSPLLRAVLMKPQLYSDERLQAAATLTLAKFMMVSGTFCEDNMQLLITVLKRSNSSTVRANIVIAFSDLTMRFPNVTQPWTHHIYERLSDRCVVVRQCTIKILSFLILHEMVRVKGQISDMALCCVDSDYTISCMTRSFFKQLSQKGNSLYNVMPDIISRLSDPTLNVEEEDFRSIMKYITSLIQKDRQMEALVEKLCHRFKLSKDERQWRDLAYCLSLFNYNERSIRKLTENLDCYKDKLYSKGVYESFRTLMANANKSAKADLKAVVSELNDKIEECFAVTNNEDESRADETQTGRSGRARKSRSTRRSRRTQSSDDDSDDNDQVATEGVTSSARKSNRRTATNKNFDYSSDEEDRKTDEGVFKRPPVKRTTRRKK